MIFPLAGLIFGAVLGLVQSRRRGGNRKDQAQWATVYALIFGLVGLFAMIIIERVFF